MTTYNTGNAIGSTDARDLLDNAQALDEAINSTSPTYTDRRGVPRRTLPSLQAEFPQSAANAAAAAGSAANAAAAAQTATTQAGLAQTARTGAEAARDAALIQAGVYATTAAGLAATTGSQYFSVPVASGPDALILYRHDAGPIATEVTRYMSASTYSPEVPLGFAWAVLDAENDAAIGIQDDGTFVVADLDARGNINVDGDLSLNGGLSTSQLQASQIQGNKIEATGKVTIANTQYTTDTYLGLAWVVADEGGNASLGVKNDGAVVAKDMEVDNITARSIAVDTLTANNIPSLFRGGGVYSHSLNYINNSGQSLGEGSTPAVAVTTSQEYDNVGFARGATSALVALTVANTQVGSRGESPMYGTLGHIKELIAKENGVPYTENDYQLAASNTAYSGYSITQLYKGTAPYSLAISQIQAAYNIASAAGHSMSFQATTWTQGESDATMAKDTYKGHLKNLAANYNTDAKAITGQYNNAILITYQCATVNRDIAIAQLEASNESELVYVACPMYQFEYGDSLHITAESSKWLGGYYGLVYKRVVVDKQDWKPLQPIAHAINGNTIDLVFNKTGLVLDTSLVPAQTNSGFSVLDGSNVAKTISSVTVVAPNRVRLVMATTPAPGWSVRYGYGSATGKSPFVGGCGNLRDSQGDSIVYSAVNKPMHNLCVIFNYAI